MNIVVCSNLIIWTHHKALHYESVKCRHSVMNCNSNHGVTCVIRPISCNIQSIVVLCENYVNW